MGGGSFTFPVLSSSGQCISISPSMLRKGKKASMRECHLSMGIMAFAFFSVAQHKTILMGVGEKMFWAARMKTYKYGEIMVRNSETS